MQGPPFLPSNDQPANAQPSAVTVEVAPTKEESRSKITYSWKNQFSAIMRKNFTVQKRQVGTNLCQACFPLGLLTLLFVIQLLVDSIIASQYGSTIPAVTNPAINPAYFFSPQAATSGAFSAPSCGERFLRFAPNGNWVNAFESSGSLDNMGTIARNYSSKGYPVLPDAGSGLLGQVTLRNTFTDPQGLYTVGAQFFPEQGARVNICQQQRTIVTSLAMNVYSSLSSANTAMYSLWSQGTNVLGGWFFKAAVITANAVNVNFNVFTNETITKGNDVASSSGLISNALFRSICNLTTACASASDGGELSYLGYKAMPTAEKKNTFDLIAIIAPYFLVYIFQLMLPVFLSNIVSEKEEKLKEIMKMMGLKESVYGVATYLFCLALYGIGMALMWIIGLIYNFSIFRKNSAGVIFILILLWGNVMVSLAFLLSTCFTKARSAIVVGYLYVFVTGIYCQSLINSFFQDSTTPAVSLFFIMCMPAFALFRGLYTLGIAVRGVGNGIAFSDLGKANWEYMSTAYAYLFVQWMVFILLYLYIASMPPKAGKCFDFFYCFKCQKEKLTSETAVNKSKWPAFKNDDGKIPVDVAGHARVANDPSETPIIRVNGLTKWYGDKLAVDKLFLAINEQECFGFLGPNGAGKSTTINMLCGYVTPSSGRASLANNDIFEQLDQVHLVMGVCPQENILWSNLTAGEHLRFYGRVKGLLGIDLDRAVDESLMKVTLLNVKDKKAGEFSGGMKRRLCVAISLIGDPEIVLLDEPTTGLDAGARKEIWKVVRDQKKRSCIMLTTHSMEEAEELCDRLGIFVGGKLECIGTSNDLKRRFAKAYKLTISSSKLEAEALQSLQGLHNQPLGKQPTKEWEETLSKFVLGLSKSAILLNSISGTQNWELPMNEVQLSELFRIMELPATKERLGIMDWGVCNATLEEVFVKIVNKEPISSNTSTVKVAYDEEKKRPELVETPAKEEEYNRPLPPKLEG